MSENAELDRSLKIVAERMNRLKRACKLVKAQKANKELWDRQSEYGITTIGRYEYLQRALKALHEIIGDK